MQKYRLSAWKILTIVLMFYTVIGGMLIKVPRLPILNETIRNQHFHVCMWFAMIIMLTVSLVNSVKYLRSGSAKADYIAAETANMGVVFGLLGIVTGMIWAKYTWGEPWSGDPKQNAAAIGLLIYLAYVVLRGSFSDDLMRARVSAIYNIFSYAVFIPLIFILPRLTDSLHPGNGGNPGFSAYDLDANLRMVFYPAIIGWTLLGWWISDIRVRTKLLQHPA